MPSIDHSNKFVQDGDILYVNTWIGCYFDSNKSFNGECSLRFSYSMFKEIYEYINSVFSSNLKLGPIENYFSFVDYSKFDISNADKFLIEFPQTKILFSNGSCLSGQCDYYGDMSFIIDECAKRNENKIFIATHKFNTKLDNIKFTEDILQLDRCDLNEISYISTFCDIIIGRNSGPFCFSMTKQNILDSNKTFYAFGSRETDCFCYGVDIDSNFIFEYFESIEGIQTSILNILEK